jgi:hypothetical protein
VLVAGLLMIGVVLVPLTLAAALSSLHALPGRTST